MKKILIIIAIVIAFASCEKVTKEEKSYVISYTSEKPNRVDLYVNEYSETNECVDSRYFEDVARNVADKVINDRTVKITILLQIYSLDESTSIKKWVKRVFYIDKRKTFISIGEHTLVESYEPV